MRLVCVFSEPRLRQQRADRVESDGHGRAESRSFFRTDARQLWVIASCRGSTVTFARFLSWTRLAQHTPPVARPRVRLPNTTLTSVSERLAPLHFVLALVPLSFPLGPFP